MRNSKIGPSDQGRMSWNPWEWILDGSLPSYCLAGGTALLLSWVLTGCRLGSRVEEAPAPVKDTVSGFYQTTIDSMEACILRTDETDPRCTRMATEFEPAALHEIMTNPVALLLQSTSTLKANFFSPFAVPDANGQIPSIEVSADLVHGTLTRRKDFAPIPFWFDEKCGQHDLNIVDSALNGTGSGTVIEGLRVSGGVELVFQNYSQFEGDCTATLKAIVDCWEDVNLCHGADAAENKSNQAFWNEFFNPYIQGNLMTHKDIPMLRTVAYGLLYN